MEYFDKETIGYKNSENFEYRKWARELPAFNFKSDWLIKIIPPFGNAIVRFTVQDKDRKHNCSIYFDAYQCLGLTKNPYWEMYDGEECRRYLLGEEDVMMADIDMVLTRP